MYTNSNSFHSNMNGTCPNNPCPKWPDTFCHWLHNKINQQTKNNKINCQTFEGNKFNHAYPVPHCFGHMTTISCFRQMIHLSLNLDLIPLANQITILPILIWQLLCSRSIYNSNCVEKPSHVIYLHNSVAVFISHDHENWGYRSELTQAIGRNHC